jgi:hypothetical protein
MDRATIPIALQDESAWSPRVFGIVLNNRCFGDAVNHLTGEDVVFSHFIVPVEGDPHLLAPYEFDDPLKSTAHAEFYHQPRPPANGAT